ncbi:energy transducer TonB [Adhaeribacter soli]|nr:energy transducer TonB [Adhaeribacter soli]
MPEKVWVGGIGRRAGFKKFAALLVLVFLSLTVARAQEGPAREFTNPKNGLRYRIVKNDTSLIVDKMAVFPGGDAAMIKYLQQKIVYPEESRKYGKEGLVKAKFVVNRSGQIENISIAEGVDRPIDSLVVKIIREMPRWQPAYQGQTPLASRYTLPVRFALTTEAERKNIIAYEADNISFRHFKKWQVSRTENAGNVELKLEHKGFGKGGMIFVNVEKDTLDTRLHLDKKLTHFTRNNDTSRLPLIFDAPEKSMFNTYQAWKASGLMQMNAVATHLVGKYLIDVYTFKAGGKNIAVTYLQFEEDRAKTNLDFGVFQSSFKVLK